MLIRSFLICLAILCQFNLLMAQNPIVPPGMYIADPEAHAWADGRLYIYRSRDENAFVMDVTS